MGYKMQIDGLTEIIEVADNRFLWSRAKDIETQVLTVWNRNKKTGSHQLVVVPGVLVKTEIVKQARIPWERFMSDRIPETVLVKDETSSPSERSN